MRRVVAGAALVVATMLATPARADGGSAVKVDEDERAATKRYGIGVEGQLLLPIGDLAGVTNPQIGTLFRFGVHVTERLEITLRAGYLLGLTKQHGTEKTSLSTVPLWAGVRWFFADAISGPYAAAELGVSRSSASTERGGLATSSGTTRLGANLGAGYVISRALPVDVRAQITRYNLLLTDRGENDAYAIGLSAGYTFQF